MDVEDELVDGPAPLVDGQMHEMQVVENAGVQSQYSEPRVPCELLAKVLQLDYIALELLLWPASTK